MDLAALDLPVDAIQCAHAAEALGYAGQAQERRFTRHVEASHFYPPHRLFALSRCEAVGRRAIRKSGRRFPVCSRAKLSIRSRLSGQIELIWPDRGLCAR